MQIFELHFNPKLREDRVFDSFVYEPENIYEKRLGSLYMVGELQNTLPQNSKLLDNLAGVIKKNYYILSVESPEKTLSRALKKTNEFLSKEVKKENVSWLGNLNFTVFSLKDFNLTFTKTGELKILLLRKGQIIDIGKNLDLEEIEPYPLKIFFNVVSGKLAQNDIILVLTEEVFKFFSQQNLLNKIAALEPFDEKNLRKTLPSQLFTKGEGLKVSGICFLAVLKEKTPQKQPKEIILQKQRKFSWSQIFSPISKPLLRIKEINKFKKFINPFKKSKEKKTSTKKIKVRELKLLTEKLKLYKIIILALSEIKESIRVFKIKRNIILISLLALVLLFGFLTFKAAERKKEIEVKNLLGKIEEKVLQAENFLIFKDEEKANSLFKEVWQEILPLIEKETSLKSEIISLKQSIEKNLGALNKLEKIESPEILLELKTGELGFSPQKILFFNSNIYFYSPLSPKLYDSNKEKVFEANRNLELADSSSKSILFFSKSNLIVSFKNEEFQEKIIQLPEFDFNFDLFSSYASNLYFLDKEKSDIIKYQNLGNFNWNAPQVWLKEKEPEKSFLKPKSLTVDGSIWILNKDNSISRFHAGGYQETVNLDIFPLMENITKIQTKPFLPYLYFLEPIKKRIIITDKTGRIVRQFQSEKFDNLKDFEISNNGKTIWLLNGLEVYKIEM